MEKNTVLYVEDNEINAKIMEHYFNAKTQLNLKIAATGREALDILKQSKSLRAILMDLYLPDMSGFDLIKQIRADENFKLTPVVAVTAESVDRQKFLDAGFNDAMEKPLNFDYLKELIIEWESQ